jgi:hypothetical protein
MAFTRAITIPYTNVPSDQTNFPVCFTGTYAYLATVANGGDVESNSGYDIVFCTNPASPLASKLPFERVSWSATTGAVEVYINIPTLSAETNTVIYVYYGDSSITTDQQNITGTWNSGYAAVFHFGNGSSLNLNDSTSNGNTLTNQNSATAATSLLGSAVGGAVLFVAASSQLLSGGNSSSLTLTGNMYVELLFNLTSLPSSSADYGCVSKFDLSNGWVLNIHANSGGNARNPDFQTRNGGAVTEVYYTTAQQGVTTYSAGRLVISTEQDIIVGSQTHSATPGPSAIGSTSAPFYVGAYNVGGSPVAYMDGVLDEVRISNVSRSFDYATTVRTNLLSPSTFYSIGAASGGTGEVTQSVIEFVVLQTVSAQVVQSAIELIIFPGTSPAAAPGLTPIVGGLPTPLGNCRPKNVFDDCLLQIEDLWRKTKIPSQFKPCIGIDLSEVPWMFDYAALPPESEPFQQIGTITTPTTASGDNLVTSLLVPNGYDGLLTGLVAVYSGTGFSQGSGDILWRVKVNLRYLKDLGSVPYAYGQVKLPAPLTEGELLLSDQLVSYIVNVPNLSGHIQIGTSKITCGLFGFFWPRGAVFEQTPKVWKGRDATRKA